MLLIRRGLLEAAHSAISRLASAALLAASLLAAYTAGQSVLFAAVTTAMLPPVTSSIQVAGLWPGGRGAVPARPHRTQWPSNTVTDVLRQ